jgi:hypothetical protein
MSGFVLEHAEETKRFFLKPGYSALQACKADVLSAYRPGMFPGTVLKPGRAAE